MNRVLCYLRGRLGTLTPWQAIQVGLIALGNVTLFGNFKRDAAVRDPDIIWKRIRLLDAAHTMRPCWIFHVPMLLDLNLMG